MSDLHYWAVLERELDLVLKFVGPNEHLFICGINQACHKQHHTKPDAGTPGVQRDPCSILWCSTSDRAAFASPSRLQFAMQCGFLLTWQRKRSAGRFADPATLLAAEQLGLQIDNAVCRGAAEAACLSNLRWLAEEHQVPLPRDIASSAAIGGSVEMLTWLQSKGFKPDLDTMVAAAKAGRLPAVQFLHSLGVEWDEDTACEVAERGHFELLRWILANGCPLGHTDDLQDDAQNLGDHAGHGGHVEMLSWLQEQYSVDYRTTQALQRAAYSGHVAAMGWLMMQGCEADVAVSARAARGAVVRCDLTALQYLFDKELLVLAEAVPDAIFSPRWAKDHSSNAYLLVLRWLREAAHCPWNRTSIAQAVVAADRLDVLQYIHSQEPLTDLAELTALLVSAGAFGCLEIAKWLRGTPHAPWPDRLCSAHGEVWPDRMVDWARTENCTSLAVTEQNWLSVMQQE